MAQYYVQIRTYEQQILLTRANVELQKETLRLVTARFEGRAGKRAGRRPGPKPAMQTEATIPVLEISLRTANNQLCVLMGRPTVDLEPQIGPADIPVAPPDVAVGIPADLLRRRPDVRRAERMAAAQAARIGVAISDWYPHISILGTVDWQAQSISSTCSAATPCKAKSGRAFNGTSCSYGRILNNVRSNRRPVPATGRRLSASGAGRPAGNRKRHITFIKSHEQARDLLESVIAARKAVVIALAQYKAGMIDFNRVSLVEQNLVTQQNLQAQARGSIAQGLIQTYRALGGGWSSRLDPTWKTPPAWPKNRRYDPASRSRSRLPLRCPRWTAPADRSAAAAAAWRRGASAG